MTWTTPWLQAGGRRLAVHIVNYDMDVPKNEMRPVTDFELRVKLPPDGRLDRATLLSPDFAGEDLTIRRDGSWAIVRVPRLEVYDIVVFTSSDELAVANTLAHAKRALGRIQVATAKPASPQTVVSYNRARGLYDRGDYAAARQAANQALAEAEKELGDVIEANVSAERKAREDTLRAAQGAVLALDFGGGEVAPGWKQVTARTRYEAAQGFGWADPTGLHQTKENLPDALHGDLISGPGEGRFRADLPDGRYLVTVISTAPPKAGLAAYMATTSVKAGDEWKLAGERGWMKVFRPRTFPVTVTGGKLELTFSGTLRCNDQGRPYQNADDWFVCGLLIRRAEAETLAGPALAEGALRDWLVTGPFDDSACMGMSTAYPPESDGKPGGTFSGKTRSVGWQRFTSVCREGLAPVQLHLLLEPMEEVVGYGLTHVLSPKPQRARLWFGSTGRAVVWLNGKEVLRDIAAAGLVADEFSVSVDLREGWNRLLVKVCNNWGDKWAFCAGVTDPAGGPLPNLRCSAGGPDEVAAWPRLFEVHPPLLRTDSDTLELGKPAQMAVELRNGTDRPISGELRVKGTGNAADALKVAAEGTPAFTALAPGQSVMRTFSVTLVRLAQASRVDLRAEACWGQVTRVSGPVRLKLLQPSISLSIPRHRFREPASILLDMEDTDPRGVWRPLASAWQGSAGVTTTVETQRVKQGKHSLKADFTSPGNGVYDHPTTGLWWEMGPNDWSCYNTLSYWVYVTDDDPAVKNRRLGTAVYNHGKRGGEQSAGHTVPVNQWTLIEEDIAFYFRDDVSEIRFFLYMSDPKKKEHYTFYFADMRLTKQAKSNPALTALLEQQAGPSDLLVLAYVDNPLTRPLAGRLSVELPEGWKVIPQSVFQVSVKAGRHVATPFCLVPAEGISGRKYPLKVRLSTKDGLELEATHEIEPLRVVLCPRADRPPAIDGAITDAAWKNAPHLSGFTLNDGSGLARAQTEAWVTADGENLYIAFKCLEPDMGSLRTRVKESNGPVWDDDHVEIFIQPRTEKPLCYRVVINPIETIRFETGRGSAVARHLRCKSRRSGDAWMIEIAIPFASLGGCPRKGDAWSFNLNRGRPARRGQPAEDSCWSCTYGSFYRPERFGTLSFE